MYEDLLELEGMEVVVLKLEIFQLIYVVYNVDSKTNLLFNDYVSYNYVSDCVLKTIRLYRKSFYYIFN